MAKPTADALAFPWDPPGTTLPLGWPAGQPAPDVVRPDLADPLEDYPSALNAALDAPRAGPRLEELVGPGTSVTVVVDDPSRWTPVREALPIILERLHARGVRPKDVAIAIGVGRHHAVDEAAMRRRLGDVIPERYRCFSPPVDDLSAYEDMGMTSDDLPVRVFGPVAKADVRVLIGSVLPHLQAGFGGGWKLIFPGTSHRSTLGALHHQGLAQAHDPAALLGSDADHNPMRRAIRAAAALLRGPTFSISHVLGPPGTVFRIETGEPDAVQDALAQEVERRFRAEVSETRPPVDVVVAGNAPWPGDPMQSFKVLLQHRAACRPGGTLVGFFRTDPGEIDRSFPLPALRAIAGAGTLGGWTIRRLLPWAGDWAATVGSPAEFLIRWAQELVLERRVLVYAPPLTARVGRRLGPVLLFDDVAALWDEVGPIGSARAFPYGGLTYAARPATSGRNDDHS